MGDARNCPACGMRGPEDQADFCPGCGAAYSAAIDPLVGQFVAEKFLIKALIGVGASGRVYQADQTTLGRTVAIKVLHPHLAKDPKLIERFQLEALAASRLNHPNTLSVIDYGQTQEGQLYIVMEYLRGQTLAQLIRTEMPLPAARIAGLMRQILAGLEEAHAAGVVHADLKADNVVVEPLRGGEDLVKVVDFGIARLVDRDIEAHDGRRKTVCGTPEYMAPEVIEGSAPTALADVYAAGVVL